MSELVLTEEQARVVAGSTGSVAVRDPEGRPLGLLQPLGAREVETILRLRAEGAFADDAADVPSDRVQAMLRKFHEIDGREGVTPEQVQEILGRVHAGEAP